MKYELEILLKVFNIKGRNKRRASFESFTERDIKLLSEVVHNLLKGKVVLSSETKSRLKKRADWIRKFENRDLPIKRKINLILNHPTIYTQIFKILLPMAIEYFNRVE